MTFTRDFVTRENHCRIASLVTKKIVIHGNSCIILYFIKVYNTQIENEALRLTAYDMKFILHFIIIAY